MAEAKASPVRYLGDESPESIEANRRYQEALAKLTESLDTRKNRLFDPTMLAMAQGFLTPGQTGGFGESLGNVAKNVGAVQEQEIKREQEVAQQRLGLASQGLELQRSKADYAAGQDWLRSQGATPGAAPAPAAPAAGPLSRPTAPPEPPTGAAPAAPVGALTRLGAPTPAEPAAPPSGPAPAVAPRPAPPAAPQGALPARAPAIPDAEKPPGYQHIQGIPIMPPNPSITTKTEHVARNLGRKPLAELMKEGEEMERHRWQKTETGMVDLRTGLEFPKASAERIDMPIFGAGYNGKSFNISKTDALKLGRLQAEGNEAEYKQLADRATGTSFGKKPGEPPSKVLSVSERARAEERTKALEGAATAEEITVRQDFNTRSKNANDTLATANTIRRMADDPSFSKMTGILSNEKVASGLAMLVRDGIGGKNFSIGIPAIEEVMRNANLNPQEQAKYRTFLMYTAQMQLDAEKTMKGSTTERERLILGNSKISPQDTAQTVRMKADLLTARAQFDRRAAKAYKKSDMTAEEFLDSPEYGDMHVKLMEELSNISAGSHILTPTKPATPAASTKPAGGTDPFGEPSENFIRDPKTGVIRRKKAGE